MAKETWTYTFGECVENHAGMQKHGQRAETGFTLEEIVRAGQMAQTSGYQVEFYDLSQVLTVDQKALLPKGHLESAAVVVIRGGAKMFFDATGYEQFLKETGASRDIVDKKATMRGKVKNKKARWNLCYADEAQKANYEEGKGTIVPFKDVPCLNAIREFLPLWVGPKAEKLYAELNYYYDVTDCGIGYHGDSERRRIVAVRVGTSLPLYYQWYHEYQPIGPNVKIEVNGGDVYLMGEKAAGTDWRMYKGRVPTLRHAAGFHKKWVAPKVKADA